MGGGLFRIGVYKLLGPRFYVNHQELPVVGPGLALHLLHVLNGHVADLGVLDNQVRK